MERTASNPFYATELVRLVSSEHRSRRVTAGDVRALNVPSGIRDVLLRRVHRLPDDTQSLLMVAAVAGRELQPELLEYVTGLDAEQLLLGLEPAIAAGLVSGRGRLGFPVPPPAYPREPAGHRRPGGAGAAACQGGRCARGRLPRQHRRRLAQLAYQYLSAGPFGDPAKAVKYAREVARRAARQGAWQDAARHLEQALAVSPPGGPDADATRCDVLVELGRARLSGGLIPDAHAAFEGSISLADRIGDEDRMLAAAVAFGAPALWGSRE